MKSFTIKLPKQNIDPQGSLKNRILNEVKNRLPFAKWYGIHTPEDPEFSVSYAGPEDLLCFGCNRNAHFSALNKKYYRPEHTHNDYCMCPFANRVFKLREYDAISEFDMALKRLSEYAKIIEDSEKDPGYDFIYNGQPVRIYQKFIQIGYTIIPIDNPSLFLNNYRKSDKNNIINIIINISNSNTVNNIINNE